jgi:hypothetical protein
MTDTNTTPAPAPDLARLEELLAEAPTGEWRQSASGLAVNAGPNDPNGGFPYGRRVVTTTTDVTLPERQASAKLIAATHSALPALLAAAKKESLDHPDWDATDAAHPAWWRGNDRGVQATAERIQSALDGSDDGSGVIGSKELERARRGVLALRAENERLKREFAALQSLYQSRYVPEGR